MAEDAERIEERIEERIGEQWFTVDQVARQLQVHPNTIYRAIKKGRLGAAQLDEGGAIRISSGDLAKYLGNARKSAQAANAES